MNGMTILSSDDVYRALTIAVMSANDTLREAAELRARGEMDDQAVFAARAFARGVLAATRCIRDALELPMPEGGHDG